LIQTRNRNVNSIWLPPIHEIETQNLMYFAERIQWLKPTKLG